jgi:hypothetical protein
MAQMCGVYIYQRAFPPNLFAACRIGGAPFRMPYSRIARLCLPWDDVRWHGWFEAREDIRAQQTTHTFAVTISKNNVEAFRKI